MKRKHVFFVISALILILSSCASTGTISNKTQQSEENTQNRIFLSALPASYYPELEQRDSYVKISSGQRTASAYNVSTLTSDSNTEDISASEDLWIYDVPRAGTSNTKTQEGNLSGNVDYSSTDEQQQTNDSFSYNAKSDSLNPTSPGFSRTITFTEGGPVIGTKAGTESTDIFQEENTTRENYTQFPEYNIPPRNEGSTTINQTTVYADIYEPESQVYESQKETYDTSAYNKAIETAKNANIITSPFEMFFRRNLAVIVVFLMMVMLIVIVIIFNKSNANKKYDDDPDYRDTYEEIEDTRSEITDSIGQKTEQSEGETQ